MGMPSFAASNAIIYLTYGLFLVGGVAIAWRVRTHNTKEYLSSNGTQKGIPLALNFIASALGSGILFTYPEIATLCGVQGLIVYALSSSLPLLIFGYLGPIIRKRCPEGFVLTEWTRQRYGIVTALFLSFFTLVTLFLYMVAELSAIQQIVTALTGLNGLPAVIVQCVVTTIYTTIGGFKVSFITDNIQGGLVLLIIVVSVISVGVETDIDRSKIDSSGLLKSSLLGWQLVYILPVAILTNDFFISGFWLRTFAAKTDKDLRIGVTIATVVVAMILTLVGSSGLLAAWSGVWEPDNDDAPGSMALFLLLGRLPAWVVGIVLVMVITLSTAAFDSFQSGMVANGSNDLFKNKLPLWTVRVCVVLVIIPVVVLALKSPDILTIYLISDLVSASLVPPLLVGLVDRFYMWRGFEVVVGGLGGILSVFIFGTIYYGDARKGGELIILQGGLYGSDWGAFGAFVAAPVGGMLFALAAFALRIGTLWLWSRFGNRKFDAFDRPVVRAVPDLDDVEVESQYVANGKFI
ncbi:hypothetical protein P152DRAFT_400132 [Eremomyces bilateralis CBS 781.70]|uniref:Urea transporter n=1 Tax=Eremomyces bilateralis CBS 781.70 TaxID=1392243 RepID=A0A6G1FZ64_9PEZI|nr:uncharacterized protein P152DRAFT_400132 [Eremomyces bilateralis CBS 781.70]KAF1811083.1 hypothetical protein P152DRAFT_400132 [Eremomyces bilateralis CBS 781.70]